MGVDEKHSEREQVKALVSMLPKVKIISQREDYLAGLDSQERKRVLLREYFDKLRRKQRPPKTVYQKLAWIVCQKPFPQLFEYKEGDDVLFADCLAVKFTRFTAAYKLYIHLLKFELETARAAKSAGYYKEVRDKG